MKKAVKGLMAATLIAVGVMHAPVCFAEAQEEKTEAVTEDVTEAFEEAAEQIEDDNFTAEQCYENTHFPKLEVFLPDIISRMEWLGDDFAMPEPTVEEADSGVIYHYQYAADGKVIIGDFRLIAEAYAQELSQRFESGYGVSLGTQDALFDFPEGDNLYPFLVDGYRGMMVYGGEAWVQTDDGYEMTDDLEIAIRIIKNLPDFFRYDESVSQRSLSPEDTKAQADAAATEDTEQPTEKTAHQEQNMKKATTRLNIREKPSTDAAILGKVEEGHAVKILEDAGDGWVHILYPDGGNIEGYVRLEYLS